MYDFALDMEHREKQLAEGSGQQTASMLEVGGALRFRLEAKVIYKTQ
jgi:hypothetical protein